MPRLVSSFTWLARELSLHISAEVQAQPPKCHFSCSVTFQRLFSPVLSPVLHVDEGVHLMNELVEP